MWLWSLFSLALLVYALLLTAIYLGQTRLLFPAHAVGPAGPLPENGQRLVLHGAGHRLHGIHLRPPRTSIDDPLILVFGGNAWNAESAALYVHDLFSNSPVVAFHYRGYAPSEGLAGARALQDDALLSMTGPKRISGIERSSPSASASAAESPPTSRRNARSMG